MWDTMEQALEVAISEGCADTVDYCIICESWTYTDHDGYPVCYCS